MEDPKKKSIRRSNAQALDAIIKARVYLRDIDADNTTDLKERLEGIIDQVIIAEGNLMAQETVISIL